MRFHGNNRYVIRTLSYVICMLRMIIFYGLVYSIYSCFNVLTITLSLASQ
jgi:hypothetical protein